MATVTPTYPDAAFVATRRRPGTHNAYLTATAPSKSGSQRDDYYLYDLTFENEVIVTGSAMPELDACRILVARGITGKLAVYDAATMTLRYTVDIEAGAKLTIIENRRSGPRFGRWESYEARVSKAKKAADTT
jgi:hypothetical protein